MTDNRMVRLYELYSVFTEAVANDQILESEIMTDNRMVRLYELYSVFTEAVANDQILESEIMTDNRMVRLYELYSVFTEAVANDQILEKSSEYRECLQAVKGGPLEKKLSIQIITKFFKYFVEMRELQEEASNCMIDLCEDPDSEIRICAIKHLPNICKENKHDIVPIANMLSQLLCLSYPEFNAVSNSLVQVYKFDPANTLKGIFNNINQMDENALREKIVKFTYTKFLKLLDPGEQQKIDDILLTEARNMIRNCSSEELVTLMTYMATTEWAKLQGQQEMFQIIEEQIEIDEPFSLNDIDCVVICIDLIMPIFDINLGDSSRFVTYYCREVLPKFQEILSLHNGDQFQFKLLKQLALMSDYCKHITPIAMDSLLEFIPNPPPNVMASSQKPNFDFCHVEYILYTFYNLSKILPEFLLNDQEKFNDLRTKLQYLSQIVSKVKQGMEMRVNENLEESLSEVETIRLNFAPKVLDNLLVIIQAFMHQPPLYTASVQLSFTVVKTTIKVQEKPTLLPESPVKRRSHVPITFSSANTNSEKPQEVTRNLNQLTCRGGFGGRGRGIQGPRGRPRGSVRGRTFK